MRRRHRPAGSRPVARARPRPRASPRRAPSRAVPGSARCSRGPRRPRRPARPRAVPRGRTRRSGPSPPGRTRHAATAGSPEVRRCGGPAARAATGRAHPVRGPSRRRRPSARRRRAWPPSACRSSRRCSPRVPHGGRSARPVAGSRRAVACAPGRRRAPAATPGRGLRARPPVRGTAARPPARRGRAGCGVCGARSCHRAVRRRRVDRLSSSTGSRPSRARASPGTRRGPRRPRRSCTPAGWPRRRTPAGPSARRR